MKTQKRNENSLCKQIKWNNYIKSENDTPPENTAPGFFFFSLSIKNVLDMLQSASI